LERAYKTTFDLPDAFPAAANASGLWESIKKFAPKVLDYLDSDLAAAIPGIGGAVRAGAKLGKQIIPKVQEVAASQEYKDLSNQVQQLSKRRRKRRQKQQAIQSAQAPIPRAKKGVRTPGGFRVPDL
jgi:hypothetical protein